MKKIKFSYEMSLEFENNIHDHYFTLRCFPKNSERQRISKFDMKVEPYDMLCVSKDSYGNTTYIGHKISEHNRFSVEISGEAYVDWQEYEKDTNLNMCYRKHSKLTAMSRDMEHYYMEKYSENKKKLTNYKLSEYIMHDIYNSFEYCKGATNIGTTAIEAFESKKGVCQDIAHVMIAFLRRAKIPARYVVGIMNGEGASHAWVEAYCKDRWYGFDPTNNVLIDDNYIIFSKGKDAKDCTINQGKFYGNGNQKQTVIAKVEEING